MSAGGYIALVLVLTVLFVGSVYGVYYFYGQMKTSDSRLGIVQTAGGDRAKQQHSRNVVVSNAVLLAVEMARVDGFIAPKEMDGIHDFIVEHVKRADQAYAANMMRRGIDKPAGHAAVDSAIKEISEVASEEQTRLVIQLLVYVAQADGIVCPEEKEFMQRIGKGLGLSVDEVDKLIELDEQV